MPQIEKKRTFDDDLAIGGLRLILWGMFKKVVIADRNRNPAELGLKQWDGK